MADCSSRDNQEDERARKKPRHDNDETSAAGPSTAQEAAAPAEPHAPPDASVVQRILAELIQELERDGADAAKSSKLLNTYQVFLNAFGSDEALQLGFFQCAIERNNLTMVQYLVESGGLDLELPGLHGLPPPLALACALGRIEIAKCLVRQGAQVNSSVRASVMANELWVLGDREMAGRARSRPGSRRLPRHDVFACGSSEWPLPGYEVPPVSGCRRELQAVERGEHPVCGSGCGQLRILEYLVEHKIGKLDRLGEMTDCLEPAVQDRQVGIVRYILSKGEFTRKQAFDCLAMAIKGKQMEIFELLVSYKALEDVEEVSRLQLLRSAIEVGLVGAVELLLQDGASVAQQITPISPAVVHLNLQDRASIVEEITTSNLTAVHLMAKFGNTLMLQLLERISTEPPVDFDIRTVRHGLTPLHIAAFQGRINAVRYLLSVLPSDYDMSLESNCHNTALNGAAEGGHIEIVKFLLSRGAAIQRHGGASALCRAASEGHFEIVQYLCEHGAAINFLGSGDVSVLQVAVLNQHVEIVEYLLEEWSADPTILSDDGWTALDHSMSHPAVLRVLLAHGAYQERDLQDTSQTLCYAILRGSRVEGIKMLVAHGANVNAEFVLNKEETPLTFTPLIIAAITGQLAIVELLCESGADVEGRTNVGECTLMFAAEKGYFGVVKYLVEEQNADVSCTSAFLFTPIEIAKRQDHANVVQCLLEHGADSPQREMISLETFLELPELVDEAKTKLRAEYTDSVAYWERQGLYDDFFDQYLW